MIIGAQDLSRVCLGVKADLFFCQNDSGLISVKQWGATFFAKRPISEG